MQLRSRISPESLLGNKEEGQALVTLLIFVATAMVVILGAIGVVMVTSFGTGKLALGEEDYHLAEAGVENAILRLLRDHNYPGETLNIGNGSVIITISGGGNKTILGEAVLDNNFRRKIKIEGNLASNSFSLTRWVEVP